ncbi:integral membrane protein [Mycobacteroides abscessus subsp. abscessus]|nr:integral membrane protein [Mycobacteroides abscessus subsp. abscessus]
MFGIRLPWLLLGVAVYPALFLIGRLYVALAERNEADFLDVTRD